MDGVFAILGVIGSLRKDKTYGLSNTLFRIIVVMSLLILFLTRCRLVFGTNCNFIVMRSLVSILHDLHRIIFQG